MIQDLNLIMYLDKLENLKKIVFNLQNVKNCFFKLSNNLFTYKVPTYIKHLINCIISNDFIS